MHINIKKENALRIMAVVGKAVPSKTVNPVLKGIVLEANEESFVFTAGDSVFIKGECLEECEIWEEGKVILPPNFINILQALPEDVEIKADESFGVEIKSGKSTFNLNGMDPEEYPSIDTPDESWEMVQFKEKELKHLLQQTLFAVSSDIGRPQFNGVLLSAKDGKFMAVGTDTFRLSVVEKEQEDKDFCVLVPGKSLAMLLRILDDTDAAVSLYFKEKKMCIQHKEFLFSFSLLEEKDYPDVLRIFPEKSLTTIEADMKALQMIIDRAALIAQSEKRIVRLQVDGNKVKVSAQSEVGKMDETLSLDEKKGENFTARFNVSYLQEALKVANDKATLNFNGETGPSIFQENGFRHLILPVKLKQEEEQKKSA